FWQPNRHGNSAGTQNRRNGGFGAILRNRKLGGYKFTQQYPIGPYFAGFACRQRNLVIEVDGSAHPDQAGHDGPGTST
ncbi:MAG: DUF559 domain-containing protein, partial [Rhizobiales bacterium]|nr:DUF559 domain-containing protein [Hyphomicrobiales bacterium]